MTKIKVAMDRHCPICKSRIQVVERREGNGIMGPGNSSWIVDTHGECINNDCRIKVGIEPTDPMEKIEKQ
jgi:uncharacterized protein YbaR (Trm112 family)